MHLRNLLVAISLSLLTGTSPITPTLASPAPAPQTSGGGGGASELADILTGAKDLLTPQTVQNIVTIVNGAALLLGGDTPKNLQGLLSANNIQNIQDLLDNAHALLTPGFVNKTAILIDEAAPVSISMVVFLPPLRLSFN